MNATNEFPPLKIERMADGLLNLIDPTDDGSGNIWAVRVHPQQLRWIAEQAGLIRETSASEAELLRTERQCTAALRGHIARLIPWLEMIEARAAQLHENIMSASMNGHEDVHIEVAQSSALADIAEQVCADAKAAMFEPSRVCLTTVPRDNCGTTEGETPSTGQSGTQCPIGNTPEKVRTVITAASEKQQASAPRQLEMDA